MKSTSKIIVIALIGILSVNTLCSAEMDETEAALWEEITPTTTVDATVTIKESNVERNVDKTMLSAQSEIDQNNAKNLLEEGTTEISDAFINFAQGIYKYPVFRIGGTSVEYTNMINNVGPVASRKPSMVVSLQPTGIGLNTTMMAPQVFGPVELIKMFKAINPDFALLPCLSLTCATPEDNANFVAFLTHKAGQSKWGTLRASLGLVEPVKVFAFEMGNELDRIPTSPIPQILPWYVKTAQAHIDAIKAVCPDAKFIICGKSCPWADLPKEDWRQWTIGVAKGLGADMDYYAFHFYYDGYTVEYMEYFMDQIDEDLASVLGKDNKVKIVPTEHARWGTDNNPTMISLASALSTAHFFNRMYRRNDIAGANYHNLYSSSNLWSLFQYRDNEFMESVVGHMFRVYDKGLGDRIVESNVESDSLITDVKSSQCRLTVLASAKDKHNLYLILNNKDSLTDMNLSFEFENDYKLVEETVFTAPRAVSYVYNKNAKNICSDTVSEKNEDHFKSYHMPNKSLVVLKLETKSDLPLLGEQAASGEIDKPSVDVETDFTDLDYHWAKAEIAKMKELGFVQGVTPAQFAPESNITRAEFASVLAKMLKLNTDYPNTVFKDLSDADWYTGSANATYVEGYIRGDGDYFRPDDCISLEEVIAASVRVYKQTKLDAPRVEHGKLISNFKSMEGISDWAESDVMYAAGIGLLYRLYENGYLRTNEPATRAQTISILYRLYNLVK